MITLTTCLIIVGYLLNILFIGLFVKAIDESTLGRYMTYKDAVFVRVLTGVLIGLVPYLNAVLGLGYYSCIWLNKIERKWEAFFGVITLAILITLGIGIHAVL